MKRVPCAVLPHSVAQKDEPPPWGRAAALGECIRTGERTCCLKGPGEGGKLARGCELGGSSWPCVPRCRAAFGGDNGLGGRCCRSDPAPIRGLLGGSVS